MHMTALAALQGDGILQSRLLLIVTDAHFRYVGLGSLFSAHNSRVPVSACPEWGCGVGLVAGRFYGKAGGAVDICSPQGPGLPS